MIQGRICELIQPYRNVEKSLWKVRIEASRALLDLKYHSDGIDAVLTLFMNFLEGETSLRGPYYYLSFPIYSWCRFWHFWKTTGEVKLAVHVMHICQVKFESETEKQVQLSTSIALLHLLTSKKAFNNIFLRHYLFCILQILAGRYYYYLSSYLELQFSLMFDRVPQFRIIVFTFSLVSLIYASDFYWSCTPAVAENVIWIKICMDKMYSYKCRWMFAMILWRTK